MPTRVNVTRRGWSYVLHEQPSEQAVSKEDSWRFGNQGRWLYQRLYVPSFLMYFSLSLSSAAAFLEFHEVRHFFVLFLAPSTFSSALPVPIFFHGIADYV